MIQEFIIEDLSNWYIRRCRRRFWKSEFNADKDSAYETLHEVLVTISKMLAPFVPFLSEEMYQNIVRSFSRADTTGGGPKRKTHPASRTGLIQNTWLPLRATSPPSGGKHLGCPSQVAGPTLGAGLS